MALLVFDGFEADGNDDLYGGGDPVLSSTVRTGTGNRSVTTPDDTGSIFNITIDTADDVLLIGFAMRTDEASPDAGDFFSALRTSNDDTILGFRINDIDSTEGAGLSLDSGGTSQVLTGAFALASWYYLEVKIDLTNELITVRIDNEELVTDQSVTLAAWTGDLRFRIGGNDFKQDNIKMDDLYILDSTGTDFNDFLGDVRIFPLEIAADGANLDWTPDSGTDHFARVDHIDGDDFDSGYIESDATGERDSFTLNAIAGVPDGFTPMAVAVQASTINPSGDPFDVDGFVRVGGVDYDRGEAKTPGASASRHRWVWQNNPDTSAAWTQAEIEAMEIGVRSI